MKSGAALLILLTASPMIADNRVLSLQVLLKALEVRYGLKVARRPVNRFRNVSQIVFDSSSLAHLRIAAG